MTWGKKERRGKKLCRGSRSNGDRHGVEIELKGIVLKRKKKGGMGNGGQRKRKPTMCKDNATPDLEERRKKKRGDPPLAGKEMPYPFAASAGMLREKGLTLVQTA